MVTLRPPPKQPTRYERLTLLMKMYEICVNQEKAIKDEENGWVRAYWAFYAVIAALGTMGVRALPAHASPAEPGPWEMAAILGVAVCVLCMIATMHFMTSMMQLRHSYYGIRDRLHRSQYLMKTGTVGEWGEIAPARKAWAGLLCENAAQYDDNTKPRGTFLQRLVMLIVGHSISCVAVTVGVGAVAHDGRAIGIMALVLIASIILAVRHLYATLESDRQHFMSKYGANAK